ncbi:MAG: oligosaccharide flippase family protein [Candidatus Dormibacteraeota bacterium]|nr:oligosaccharide flippase family protein [Candidatus Dormibacteraeota bacterium]
MSLAHRTVRNTTMLFVARTGARLLVFVAFIIQQHALHAFRYGEFGVVVVLSNLSSIVGDGGLQIVYLREGSRDRKRLEPYLAAILGAKVPLLLLSLLCLFVMSSFTKNPSVLPLLWPAFALLVATSLANLLRSTFYATGEMRYEAFETMSEGAILLAGTAFAWVEHLGLAAYLWAYAASYLFTCLFAVVIIGRRYFHPHIAIDYPLVRRLIRMGLPFAMVFFLNTIYFKIDVLILDALRNTTEVGYYQAGYKFLEGLSFLPQTVMNAVFPALSILHLGAAESMRRAYTVTLRLLAGLAMPMAIALALAAGPLLGFLHIYSQSAPAVSILALALVFLFVNNTFVFGLGAMDRQLDSIKLSVMSIVVNVVLNFVMIPLFPYQKGYLACSWATVITEVFLLVAGYVLVRRQLGPLPWVRSLIPIIVSGGLMVGVMGVLSSENVFWVVPVAGILYLGSLWLTGGVTPEELRMARQSLRRRLAPEVEGIDVG